jgi:ribosome maturation factor RimP
MDMFWKKSSCIRKSSMLNIGSHLNVHSKVSSRSSLFLLENGIMAKVDAVTRITEIAEEIVAPLGMGLVDLEYKREGRDMVVRLFLEKEGGITLDDCSSVSRELSDILDVEDFMPEHYTLEVSSPGICRPLKKIADYERFVGSLVKVKTFEQITDDGGNKRKTLLGTLTGVKDGVISIHLQEGQNAEIPLDKVAKANLEFEF